MGEWVGGWVGGWLSAIVVVKAYLDLNQSRIKAAAVSVSNGIPQSSNTTTSSSSNPCSPSLRALLAVELFDIAASKTAEMLGVTSSFVNSPWAVKSVHVCML